MGVNNNKTIALNTGFIFVRLIIVSLVGLFASRIVLDALGASDYGLYNVVGGIVTLLNVFNTAMLSTTYRYIAAELGKGSEGNLNKVFNICFLIHATFALIIVLLGITIGEWYIHNYLNVNPERIGDAEFVFLLSLFTSSLSVILVPYQGLLTAYEKFNVLAIRDIVTKILYLVVIYSVLYSDKNRIRLYAWIQLGYTILYNGSYLVYCIIKYSKVIRLRLYKEFGLIKEMMGFAFWILFGTISSVGKSQGSVILINYFFGPIVNAAYAVASQLESFIQQFARSLNTAAVPQITKSYSGGNAGRSMSLTSYISKYTFILMAIVAFPVLLEMDFLLSLWLKQVPEGTVAFCKLLVLSGLLGTLGEGIPALIAATGNIRFFQVVFYLFNLLGLPVAWILFKMGYNQNTLLVLYCVINFINTFIRLSILKRYYHFDISQLIKVSYVRVLYMSLPLIAFYYIYTSRSPFSNNHIIGLIISEFFLLVDVVSLGLESKERDLIKVFVLKKVLKK